MKSMLLLSEYGYFYGKSTLKAPGKAGAQKLWLRDQQLKHHSAFSPHSRRWQCPSGAWRPGQASGSPGSLFTPGVGVSLHGTDTCRGLRASNVQFLSKRKLPNTAFYLTPCELSLSSRGCVMSSDSSPIRLVQKALERRRLEITPAQTASDKVPLFRGTSPCLAQGLILFPEQKPFVLINSRLLSFIK